MKNFDLKFSLPDGVDLSGIHFDWQGLCNVTLRTASGKLDPWGASLGTEMGHGKKKSFAEALGEALLDLEIQETREIARRRTLREAKAVKQETQLVLFGLTAKDLGL
jgi:hypothetical protein